MNTIAGSRLLCSVCGQSFKSRIPNQNLFCSKLCRGRAHKAATVTNCEWCGLVTYREYRDGKPICVLCRRGQQLGIELRDKGSPRWWLFRSVASCCRNQTSRSIRSVRELYESLLTPPKLCPIYRLTLNYTSTQWEDNAPNLDRIVPGHNGGRYVPGNVRIVSRLANFERNKTPLTRLRLLVADAERIEEGGNNA